MLTFLYKLINLSDKNKIKKLQFFPLTVMSIDRFLWYSTLFDYLIIFFLFLVFNG